MGLLDTVLGGLLANHANAGPMQSVLGSILGGGAQTYGGTAGGLPGLIEAFSRAGLGGVANSWVSQGQNQRISPGQLQQVFPQEQINQWSQQTGMPQQSVLQELSNLLPHAVDRMTPSGEVSSSPFDAPGLELPRS